MKVTDRTSALTKQTQSYLAPVVWMSMRDDAARGASVPPREPGELTRGLSPRVNLNQHLNLVTVDFIGGDGAEGSIPCLKDNDRDHERGSEGGGEGVCIFAGHLFGSCLGGGGPSPARQDPAGPKTG